MWFEHADVTRYRELFQFITSALKLLRLGSGESYTLAPLNTIQRCFLDDWGLFSTTAFHRLKGIWGYDPKSRCMVIKHYDRGGCWNFGKDFVYIGKYDTEEFHNLVKLPSGFDRDCFIDHKPLWSYPLGVDGNCSSVLWAQGLNDLTDRVRFGHQDMDDTSLGEAYRNLCIYEPNSELRIGLLRELLEQRLNLDTINSEYHNHPHLFESMPPLDETNRDDPISLLGDVVMSDLGVENLKESVNDVLMQLHGLVDNSIKKGGPLTDSHYVMVVNHASLIPECNKETGGFFAWDVDACKFRPVHWSHYYRGWVFWDEATHGPLTFCDGYCTYDRDLNLTVDLNQLYGHDDQDAASEASGGEDGFGEDGFVSEEDPDDH